MVGYSIARHVNHCKCMENNQFFRCVKSFGGNTLKTCVLVGLRMLVLVRN